VIAIGVAGALSPELATGELLVAHRVMREHGDAWQAPPPWLAGAARLAGARPAALISVPRLAATVADKQRLLALTVAREPGLLAAVDLESAAFAAAATARSLPWLILRAISDGAGEALPPLLNSCLDEGGAIRRRLLAVRLLGQPSALPQLLSLRQRVRTCAVALATAATAAIESTGARYAA
jgi:nucleoside phosphorylase